MTETRGFSHAVYALCIFVSFLACGSRICPAAVEAPEPAPVISLVGISNISLTAATISWSTDVPSDSQVEYGKTFAYDTFSALNPEKVTQHVQILTSLAPGTTYHFRVMSRDADGDLAISLYDYTFRTLDLPDQVPPVISAVAITDITTSAVTIYWKTDEPSDSQLSYGLTPEYGHSSALNQTLGILHSLTLSNLSAATTYHFTVMSRDGDGNLGRSADLTFSTLGPPKVQGITVSEVDSRRATISWTTDLEASTQIAYGPTEQCELSTLLDPRLTITHAQRLEGLEPETTYHFRVLSKSADQLGVTVPGSFQTSANSLFKLAIPRLATRAGGRTSGSNDIMYTGITIDNLGGREAMLSFTARDVRGAVIAGADIVNPASRTVAARGQLTVTDDDLFGAGFLMADPVGWIEVLSTSSAVAGLSAVFNGSLSVFDSAPLFTAPMTFFIFPEIDARGPTNLHIANSNAMEALLTLVLVGSDGVPKCYASRKIAPSGALAESASNLFPMEVPESTDSIMVFSNLGIIGYESLGKGPGDMSGMNGLDATAAAKTLYSPQYVAGGSHRTVLSIVNADGMKGNVTLRMMSMNGEVIGTTKTEPIAAYGKILITDPGIFGVMPGEQVSGYVEIESDEPRIVGSVLFEEMAHTAYSAAFPLVSQLQESLLFGQIASNDTYYTGIALLNPGDNGITADISLYSPDGILNAAADVPIPAHHSISKLLTELFPAAPAQHSGYIRVTATAGVAGFSVLGDQGMKTLSAIPAQAVP